MEDVLSVYERPYDAENPVVNLDESPKQLIAEKRNTFRDDKGVIYQDYEYARKGSVAMYMLTEAKAGWRAVLVKDNHNARTYAEVIQYLAEAVYPEVPKITLIEDNLSAHKLATLYEIMPAPRARDIIQRIELVRTPKHGSWLNIAEIELSVLTRQGVGTRIEAKEVLEEKVKQWYQKRNQEKAKVDWQFKTKDARTKLKRLYPKI